MRPYVENSDGAYYYHYDEFNEKDPDGTQPSTRKAYYTTDEGEATDTETKYAVDGTAYSFVGWYEVDKETGQLIGLYNFDAGITGNTYLKAVWRSVGVYTVKYSQDGGTSINLILLLQAQFRHLKDTFLQAGTITEQCITLVMYC